MNSNPSWLLPCLPKDQEEVPKVHPHGADNTVYQTIRTALLDYSPIDTGSSSGYNSSVDHPSLRPSELLKSRISFRLAYSNGPNCYAAICFNCHIFETIEIPTL